MHTDAYRCDLPMCSTAHMHKALLVQLWTDNFETPAILQAGRKFSFEVEKD